jgi:uncharacterized protein YbcI
MSDAQMSPRTEQSVPAQISNLVVGLLHSYTGRGPTKAWTSIDEDLVSVVLRDILTTGDRSLIASGRGTLVIELRQAYQQTMGPEMIAGVEALTGRKVVAFLSTNHLDPDIAIENFVLESRSNRGVAVGSSPATADSG